MEKLEILGCPCFAVNEAQAAKYLAELVQSKELGYTVAINAEKILKHSDESGFNHTIDNAIFPYPD